MINLAIITPHSAEVQKAVGRYGCTGCKICRLLRSWQCTGGDICFEI